MNLLRRVASVHGPSLAIEATDPHTGASAYYAEPTSARAAMKAIREAIETLEGKRGPSRGGALFSTSGDGPRGKRGAFFMGPDGSLNITLFKKANLSTFLHESGHAFMHIMGTLAQRPGVDQKFKADWEALLAFVGADPGSGPRGAATGTPVRVE
jgi:hypothetical protein